MITTPPGLYLLSVGVVKPAAWLFGWTGTVVCSTGMLRFINLLISAGNFYLLYLLLLKIHQKNKVQSRIVLCTSTNSFLTACVYLFELLSVSDNCRYCCQFDQEAHAFSVKKEKKIFSLSEFDPLKMCSCVY